MHRMTKPRACTCQETWLAKSVSFYVLVLLTALCNNINTYAPLAPRLIPCAGHATRQFSSDGLEHSRGRPSRARRLSRKLGQHERPPLRREQFAYIWKGTGACT